MGERDSFCFGGGKLIQAGGECTVVVEENRVTL